MSNLILFTPRSGSTILCELLSYSQNTINLGEGIHSIIRGYNYNTKLSQETNLYKEFSKFSLTGNFHNLKTRGSDHKGFDSNQQKRINLLKASNFNWTAKCNMEKFLINIDFIDYCVDNGVNVYITHRRNILDQFISHINTRYRGELDQGGPTDKGYIFTKQDIDTATSATRRYSELIVPFSWLYRYTDIFLNQLLMWRALYERYKDKIIVVSYEDNIKPMDLTKFGITDDFIKKYHTNVNHLKPTPSNCSNIIVQDDHPKPILPAWNQTLFYVKKHQYLVDI